MGPLKNISAAMAKTNHPAWKNPVAIPTKPFHIFHSPADEPLRPLTSSSKLSSLSSSRRLSWALSFCSCGETGGDGVGVGLDVGDGVADCGELGVEEIGLCALAGHVPSNMLVAITRVNKEMNL